MENKKTKKHSVRQLLTAIISIICILAICLYFPKFIKVITYSSSTVCDLNMRESDSIDSPIIEIIRTGTAYKIIGKYDSTSSWTKIKTYDGTEGYCQTTLLKYGSEIISVKSNCELSDDNLIYLDNPTFLLNGKQQKIGLLSAGTPLILENELGHYEKVMTMSGVIGYILIE
jgi:uncharacterized protein YraI